MQPDDLVLEELAVSISNFRKRRTLHGLKCSVLFI